MQLFLNDQDYELWNIVSKGNYIPKIKKRDGKITKPGEEYTKQEKVRVHTNHRALNIFCLDQNDLK